MTPPQGRVVRPNCDCATGRGPHSLGSIKSCENHEHHCDTCHELGVCTWATCGFFLPLGVAYDALLARQREARELLERADELVRLARGALVKLGVYNCGSDLRLGHEARMFALSFSPRTNPEPPPEHSLCWTGTGEADEWIRTARAYLSKETTE